VAVKAGTGSSAIGKRTIMDAIFTLSFWKSTLELVLRGAAIAALTGMGGSLVDAWHLNWETISGMALSGGLLSLLTSLSSATVGVKGSPLVTAPKADG
jgi:hypothetical protein